MAILGLLLVPGGAAEAATMVSTTTSLSRYESETTLTFVAAPGEANRLTVTGRRIVPVFEIPEELVFHDDGAPVDVGSSCWQEDPQTAVCHRKGGALDNFVAEVALGDQADVARVDGDAGSYPSLAGGEGDDTLAARSADGGPGDDTLQARPRGSGLSGGPGKDRLIGGDGSDWLGGADTDARTTGGTPAPDVIEGGGGSDTVYYSSEDSVVVDLVAGRSVQPSSGVADTITDVESAVTGSGDDVLIGTPGDNTLDSGSGDDQLLGGTGDDVLAGGDGRDVFAPG